MSRTCPRCGEKIGWTIVSGPSTASVHPCGCTIAPDQLQGGEE
ncbi:hypothetical protein [Haladaptatus sp. DYF46]|nr:hypothetical protein [Haladaptatus sp. DYF46]